MTWERTLGLDAQGLDALRRTYGEDARDAVEDDPYVLAGPAFGATFDHADGLATSMGVALHDPLRVRAGLAEAMARATRQGNSVLPEEQLAGRTARLLGLPMPMVLPVLDGLDATDLVRVGHHGGTAYAPAWLHHAEHGIARRIRELAGGRPPWRIADPAAALRAADTFTGQPLTVGQRAAFAGVLAAKASIVTGGPGVGKTTLLKAVLHAIRSAGGVPAQGAPTGRAAMNMVEATGLDAGTMHVLLGRAPDGRGFLHHRGNPLDCDLVVLDETSMADAPMLHAVLDAMPQRAGLILMGDAGQLEPVGPGQPFADIVASGALPTFRLAEVMRQARGSRIVAACHRIAAGELPDLETDPARSDFLFYRTRGGAEAATRIVDLAARRLPRLLGIDPARDVQVLSPMNVRELGTRHLQPMLREAINPDADGDGEDGGFAPGDKVLHARNNYRLQVRNGEIGMVVEAGRRGAGATVEYGGRDVTYDQASMADLRHGYAVSVHKSQGSEFPAVVVPVVCGHGSMLTRRLLLTACSRAKRMLVLVGHAEALAAAVANTRGSGRHTQLPALLRAA